MSASEPPPEPQLPRPGGRRPRRSPWRFLWPSALLALAAVVAVIVLDAGGSEPGSGAGGAADTRGSQPGTTPTQTRRTQTSTTSTSLTTTTTTTVAGTYTIAAGDTFATIAAKTGVSVATLEQLNPGVSSSSLTIGQVIKLK